MELVFSVSTADDKRGNSGGQFMGQATKNSRLEEDGSHFQQEESILRDLTCCSVFLHLVAATLNTKRTSLHLLALTESRLGY